MCLLLHLLKRLLIIICVLHLHSFISCCSGCVSGWGSGSFTLDTSRPSPRYPLKGHRMTKRVYTTYKNNKISFSMDFTNEHNYDQIITSCSAIPLISNLSDRSRAPLFRYTSAQSTRTNSPRSNMLAATRWRLLDRGGSFRVSKCGIRFSVSPCFNTCVLRLYWAFVSLINHLLIF